MLVEINLLPQREPRKFAFLLILTCLFALLLLVGAFYFWQVYSTKNNLASIDKQISMTRRITDKENKKTDTVKSPNSVSQLKTAIDWANDYPIQTIPVLHELTSLLPERGFIQSFGYTETGTVTLSVQFDSAREAAYFLENLNESKWIEEVSLSSLAPAAVADPTSAGTSTTPTNQTSTANTSDSSNQTNTTNAATGTTANQNSTVNTTTDTNTLNNSSNAAVTSDSTTSKIVTDNILPRYTGQFEIKLNKETVKKIINESKKDEEGVTGP
jgi:Flp pilus assembly protein TadG